MRSDVELQNLSFLSWFEWFLELCHPKPPKSSYHLECYFSMNLDQLIINFARFKRIASYEVVDRTSNVKRIQS